MTNSEEKSLPKKIAEDIIAFILEENLQPGDKLPNETVLCERLNVGRSSLREAMKALASRNSSHGISSPSGRDPAPMSHLPQVLLTIRSGLIL